MLRTLDLRAAPDDLDYATVVPRGAVDVEHAVEVVRPVCEAVARDGQAALRHYSEAFDHVVPASFRVPAAELARCAAELDPALRAAMDESIRRRRLVAAAEAEAGEPRVVLAPGAHVTVRTVPVGRVGLYVPGGLAPLASSVIMNVVPAQEAGVASIAVASPPQAAFGGLPHPTILAACHLLGVDEVYAVGGAQAIAMFAYGVDGLCPRVDVITGPGNIYVVAAKRLVRGVVGIDAEAGPTEIAVLADAGADPSFVAADLLSQAEHDPMAASVLVTDSVELAQAVDARLTEQVAVTGHHDRVVQALSGQQSAIVLVRDLEQGIAVVNAYAAEHLEIQTADAADVAARVSNAGAIFVGPYAPVSLGDYAAGSTHVLPTAGAARYQSGLTVHAFRKVVHVIEYDEPALRSLADAVETFALAENLPGHAHAVTVRRPGAGEER